VRRVAVAGGAAAAAAAAPARSTVRARCLPVQILLPASRVCRVCRRIALVDERTLCQPRALALCSVFLRAFIEPEIFFRRSPCAPPPVARSRPAGGAHGPDW
jgi:hypothetical protein